MEIPVERADHILRLPRLLARLEARAPLTVLRGPYGFGKTTLVREYLRSADLRSEGLAWFVPYAEISDADQFWSQLLTALGVAGVSIPDPRDDEVPARAAVSMAIAAHGRLLLVLDSFERVTAPGVERALLDLVAQGTGLRLIVATRCEQQFADPAGLGVQATVLDAARLAWTEQETAVAFAEWDVALSIVEMAESHTYFAGWPALIHSFARDRLADPDPVPVRDAIRPAAALFVTEQLLGEISDATQRRFVRALSVAGEIGVAGARLLTGDPTPTDALHRMCRGGLLRYYDQGDERRYVWLPVARRLIREEFARRRPQVVAELDLRLVQWYRETERPDRALAHAAAMADWALVVAIIDASWRPLLFDHHELLYQVLTLTPYEAFRGSVAAAAAREVMLRVPAELAGADSGSDLVVAPRSRRDLLAQGSSPQAKRILDTDLMTMVMMRRRGQFARARALSHDIAALAEAAAACRTGDVVGLLGFAYLQCGLTRLLAGDHDGAAEHLSEAFRLGPEGEHDFVEREAAGKLALTFALTGDTKRAQRWTMREAENQPLAAWLGPTVRNAGNLARALVAIDRLAPESAMTALDAVRDPEAAAEDELWAYTVFVQARYSLLWGDPMSALHTLRRERDRHRDWHTADSEAAPLLAATEANLLIAMGQGSYARAVLSAAGRGHPELLLAWARFDLLTGDPDRALVAVSNVLFAETTSRRLRTEAQLLQAVARLRLGDVEHARETFRRVVRHIKDQDALAYFAMVPRDDLYGLAEDIRDTAALIGAGSGRGVPAVFPASLDVVRLTEREQVVLERLAEYRSAPEIATSLYVSVHTVKSQVGSLYRKLGVNCRDHAVVAAREMGLLR